MLSAEKTWELTAYRDGLNPAHLARQIDQIQQRLTYFAAEKTRTLEAIELAKTLDSAAGVKPVRSSKKHAS